MPTVRCLTLQLILLFSALACHAGSISPEPLTFFTNVADRLLRSQLDMSLRRIPIAPTNAYDLEVHRLLQLAANLYDATHPGPWPSVFRPVVGPDPMNPGGLAITEFVYDVDEATVGHWLAANNHGLPMIVGAKKGVPNFNELVTQTTVLGARKLELRRLDTNSPPAETNQMYVLGISNFVAIEAWNSYTQACCAQDIFAVVGCRSHLRITDPSGTIVETNTVLASITNVTAGAWPGYAPAHAKGGFVVPLHTNWVSLANSTYRFSTPGGVGPLAGASFERGIGFPVPQWTAYLSNSTVFLLHVNGRILDFVQLRSTNVIDLSSLLFDDNPSQEGVVSDCWRTNRLNGSSSVLVPTEGVLTQIEISLGHLAVGSEWNDHNFAGPTPPQLRQAQIDSFRNFFGLPPFWNLTVNTNVSVQAPFTPARKFVQTTSWQANDPLVHHLTEHLSDVTNNVTTVLVKPYSSSALVPTNLTNVNSRFRPWGGNPVRGGAPGDINRAIKDPGVFLPDDWDFPTNLVGSPGLVGRVHRGTPWQTVYLKSEAASGNSWRGQWADPRAHPTSDWKTVSMLLPLLRTNDMRPSFSVNEPSIAAWREVMDGFIVLSNASYALWPPQPTFDIHTMNSNSPQAAVIAAGIGETREGRQPPYFRRVGDVLATPELRWPRHG